MYNLYSANGTRVTNLRLNAPTLLKIFTGQIATWNDPNIQDLNPGMGLPTSTIVPFLRADPAGENYILSDYFATLYPSDWGAFTNAMGAQTTNGGLTAVWPSVGVGSRQVGIYNISLLQNASGVNSVESGIAGDQNHVSIGYVETAYAQQVGLPCAQVANASGNYVLPSEQADAIALTQDELQPDLEQILTGVFLNPNPLSYPVSAYSYLVTQEDGQPAANVGAVLGQFIHFLACTGQQATGILGYTPIPPNLVVDDFAAVNRLAGATTLPTPDASNCPNPYLTGQLTLPGEPIQLGTPGASGTGPSAAGSTAGTAVSSGASATGASAGASATAAAAQAAAANSAATQAAVAAAAAKEAQIASQGAKRVGTTQIPGVALLAQVSHLLGLPFSTGQMWLWCLLLVAIFAGVPVGISAFNRSRRKTHGEGTQ
jgi:phosphate transport system substrate-binding protein